MDALTESMNRLATIPVPLHERAQNTTSHSGLGLLHFPEKILLDIALSLPVKDIKSLALACQILLSVSREALLRTVPIAPSNICKLLKFFLSHPNIRSKMTQIHLRMLFDEAYCDLQSSDQEAATSITPEQLAACTNILLASLSEKRKPIQGVQGLLRGENFMSDALCILLAITPNMSQLFVSSDMIDCLPILGTICRYNGRLKWLVVPRWHAPVSLLPEQLAVLDIREGTWFTFGEKPGYEKKISCRKCIRLDRMHCLKHLTVPFDRLSVEPLREVCRYFVDTQVLKIHPKTILLSSLEYLRTALVENPSTAIFIVANSVNCPG